MLRTFQVEMEVTKTYTVKVTVKGEYSGNGDPDIEEDAKAAADNMDHELWNYKDTEFDTHFVKEIK